MNFKKYFDYDVYEDGSIYSHKTHKFLSMKPNKQGYCSVVLHIPELVRIRVHRLVAMLFISQPPEDKQIVNHKDGNKQNNHYTNLEWCNSYENNLHARQTGLNNISESNRNRYKNNPELKAKQSKKISETMIKNATNKWHNNGRFRYMILDKNGNEIYRQDLPKIVNRSQANVDKWLKNCADGGKCELFDQYGITIVDLKSKSQSTIESID